VINYQLIVSSFFQKKENFYLVSTRLISYKRIDVIIEAFNWLGWPLLIIGDGPEQSRILALQNIKFLGHVSDSERSQLMTKVLCSLRRLWISSSGGEC